MQSIYKFENHSIKTIILSENNTKTFFTLLTWSSFSSSQDKISQNQKEDSANTCNVFATHFEFLSFNIISCQMLFESFWTSNFLEKHYVYIES